MDDADHRLVDERVVVRLGHRAGGHRPATGTVTGVRPDAPHEPTLLVDLDDAGEAHVSESFVRRLDTVEVGDTDARIEATLDALSALANRDDVSDRHAGMLAAAEQAVAAVVDQRRGAKALERANRGGA